MTLRWWSSDELDSDAARERHTATAREQWHWIGFCHFWLIGRGAREKVRGEPYDTDERRIAERERVRNGWNIETIEQAHSAARANMDPVGKIPCPPFFLSEKGKGGKLKGKPNANWEPGPTVERDWPEPGPCTDEQANLWREKIRNSIGALPALASIAPADQDPDSDRWSF